MIRVTIPHHLRNLAGTGTKVTLDVPTPVTQRAVLDALKVRYPVLSIFRCARLTQCSQAVIRAIGHKRLST